ncbi:hypothetical protein OG418_00285 [Streptomyces phaeochromogenes]
MSARRNARPALRAGAHVRFRGVKWQVVALAGQDIHLIGPDGGGQVVLAGHLFADPGFAVIGAEVPQAAPQWGLFETAPAAAREKALAWQRHVREVECGLAGGPGSDGAVRPQYDPEQHTLAEREQAKAQELTALGFGRVSRTTVQRMRLAYRKQGLWGLLDHRSTRAPSPTGRADERVVAAVREALRRRRGRSKGTINGLFPLINHILEDRHGPGTVPAPSQATLYRLVTALARPGELPSGPVRQTPASFDGRAFTPTTALRPGEQVQVDTTRLDVLALFDDGTLARPELTIAIDVATRAILAAVLCPSATKAVDAALLLTEMAVPHPARPTWPNILRMDHAPALPHQRLATLDARLAGAAARPVVLPETIVIDRGKVFVSRAFTAACETLGISGSTATTSTSRSTTTPGSTSEHSPCTTTTAIQSSTKPTSPTPSTSSCAASTAATPPQPNKPSSPAPPPSPSPQPAAKNTTPAKAPTPQRSGTRTTASTTSTTSPTTTPSPRPPDSGSTTHTRKPTSGNPPAHRPRHPWRRHQPERRPGPRRRHQRERRRCGRAVLAPDHLAGLAPIRHHRTPHPAPARPATPQPGGTPRLPLRVRHHPHPRHQHPRHPGPSSTSAAPATSPTPAKTRPRPDQHTPRYPSRTSSSRPAPPRKPSSPNSPATSASPPPPA